MLRRQHKSGPDSTSFRTHQKRSIPKTVNAQPKRNPNLVGFFDLPNDVRRLVYKNLLIADALSIHCNPNKWGIHPQILRTCRTAHEEGKDILRSSNCFLNIRAAGPKQETFALKKLGRPRYHQPRFVHRAWPCLSARVVIMLGGQQRQDYDSNDDLLITSAHLAKLTNQLTTYKSSSTASIALKIDLNSTGPLSHHFHNQIMDSLAQARGLDNVALQTSRDGNSPALPQWYKDVAEQMKLGPRMILVDDRIAQHDEWLGHGGRSELSFGKGRDYAQLHMMQMFEFLDIVFEFVWKVDYLNPQRHNSYKPWKYFQSLKLQCICLITKWRNRANDPQSVISYILRFKKPGSMYTTPARQIVNPLIKDTNAACHLYFYLGTSYKERGQFDLALHAWYELWMLKPEFTRIEGKIDDLAALVEAKIAAKSEIRLADDPVVRCREMLKPIRTVMGSEAYEAGNRTKNDELAARLFVRKSIGDIFKWKYMDAVAGSLHNVSMNRQPPDPRRDPVSAA